MDARLPNFSWSTAEKHALRRGVTLTHYHERGVETVTLSNGGVFCPSDVVPKLQVGRAPDQYVALAHCDPKSLVQPDAVKAT